MISFTRKIGEEIVIGDPRKPIAVIRLTDTRKGVAKLAIDAERSVPVNRREIALAMFDKRKVKE